MKKRTNLYFNDILPEGFDYDQDLTEYYRAKLAVRKWDWDGSEAKVISLAQGISWSADHPAIRSVNTLFRWRELRRELNTWASVQNTRYLVMILLVIDSARIFIAVWNGVRSADKKIALHILRRFASWLPKVQQLKTVGYFVIEFPLKDRERFHSKAKLETAGKIITRFSRVRLKSSSGENSIMRFLRDTAFW